MMSKRAILSLSLIFLFAFSYLAIFQVQPILATTPPSSTNLRNAITYGRDFLNRLYKGLDQNGYGVISEYYGCPIRVNYVNEGIWKLAGQDGWQGSIDVIQIGSSYEEFVYHFKAPNGNNDSPRLRVQIIYFLDGSIRIKLILEALSGYATSQIKVYVGFEYYAFTYVGQLIYKTKYDYQWDDSLQTFRYAVRHGNTEGYKAFRSSGYHDQEYALWKLQSDYGFTVDVYDSAWFYSLGRGTNGYFYGFFLESYHDGDVYSSLPRGSYYYPYFSKVIIAHPASTLTYIMISRQDVLVPTLCVIHGLMKYRNPDRIVFTDDNGYTYTARQWVRFLENSYWIGYGIKDPSDATVASSVRTAVFAILETLLGYDYGDMTSQEYANQCANIFLQVQVPQNGQFTTEDYGQVTRTLYKGSFLATWNDVKYSKPQSWLRNIMDWFNMPDEYKGLVVTNQETVQIILRTLEIYLDRVYPSEHQSNTSPFMVFSERDFFNTGSTIRTKSVNLPSAGTYTMTITARDIDDKDGLMRTLNLYVDGILKKTKNVQGYDNNIAITDEFTSGVHNIGVVLTTYDHSTSDGTKPTWAVTLTIDGPFTTFARENDKLGWGDNDPVYAGTYYEGYFDWVDQTYQDFNNYVHDDILWDRYTLVKVGDGTIQRDLHITFQYQIGMYQRVNDIWLDYMEYDHEIEQWGPRLFTIQKIDNSRFIIWASPNNDPDDRTPVGEWNRPQGTQTLVYTPYDGHSLYDGIGPNDRWYIPNLFMSEIILQMYWGGSW